MLSQGKDAKRARKYRAKKRAEREAAAAVEASQELPPDYLTRLRGRVYALVMASGTDDLTVIRGAQALFREAGDSDTPERGADVAKSMEQLLAKIKVQKRKAEGETDG